MMELSEIQMEPPRTRNVSEPITYFNIFLAGLLIYIFVCYDHMLPSCNRISSA